jgi:DNA segregation ATPase FtsK/SpoIIIE-like protein
MITDIKGPYAQLSSAAQTLHFPPILKLKDARPHVADSSESAPLLGVDGNGDPVSVDLDSDSPHILVSAATGGGKSVILRSVTSQVLSQGGMAAILDLKRHSHRWAKRLTPNVAYAQDLPSIGDTLVTIGHEVHRRNQVVEEFDGPIEEAPVGPRFVVVFEEMNATMAQLKELDRKLPRGTYRALDAMRDIMFMGRAAKVHIVAVAQYATASAMGGTEIRENFNTRILIRYTERAWKMLTDVWPPQPSPSEPGRGMVCMNGKALQTQFLFMTEEEAFELVMGSAKAQELARVLTTRRERRKCELANA